MNIQYQFWFHQETNITSYNHRKFYANISWTFNKVAINPRQFSWHVIIVTYILFPCFTNLFLVNINIARCCHLTGVNSVVCLISHHINQLDKMMTMSVKMGLFETISAGNITLKNWENIYRHVQLKTYQMIKVHCVFCQLKYVLLWKYLPKWTNTRGACG